MFGLVLAVLVTVRSAFLSRERLVLENLALRQQLVVALRAGKRPRLTGADRAFWALLREFWPEWRASLVIVRPETVVRWHRECFRRFWRRKSRRGPGRPRVDPGLRELIRRMATENVGWGAPRVHGELLELGYDIHQSTVSRWMPRRRRPPSQTWRSFLANHVGDIVAIDFAVVPTVTFGLLYVLAVLRHDRRQLIHVNVTHPTAEWTAQQVVEAFPWDTAPRDLVRDRDSIYGVAFSSRVRGLGVTEVRTVPRSPWQNPYVERFIGSLRRERLDHVIVLNEAHAPRLVSRYAADYNRTRTHLALGKDAPVSRPRQAKTVGQVVAIPEVGGLHHRYERRAA